MKTASEMTKLYIPSAINYLAAESTNFPLLRNFLCDVATLYPNFDSWFNFTFRRQLADGRRKIVLAHDGSAIAGVALLKLTKKESKISTLFVSPDFRGRKVGQTLLSKSLEILDFNDVLITVSEERENELSPLLLNNGFRITESHKGLYREDKLESFFTL